ncbi:nitric-oxide reductase large subunit [Cutibacterium namnetense]|uniref:Cytochrome C and quinol oxidase polypeptide I n=1 Tax=[Propionibacterium] namnetense SK182B-JCVI TaxID=1051006 RepID=F9NWU9_9ACTN|nr:cbb3-type cytochrome c oxidase subunit I [Cutibacterium namnetense]EGR95614.1 cytochrome C and quinol oxidase polypeptide I [ [[Propionibacterium] namnetense SK182B-JCVI]
MGNGDKKPEATRRRPMVVSKGWVQGIALVMVLGFTVMGILAYHTYNDSIPIPDKVVSTTGEVLFTHDDIVAGQETFNNRGLMEYGSIVGHGGYLGPDFTADYLRRAATFTLDTRIKAGESQPHQANIKDWRTNRYDSRTGVLVLSSQQTAAYRHLVSHYTTYFGSNSHNLGLLAHDVKDPAQARQLTDFFAWTAWGSAADRPGHSYSYTSNWPADPTVANHPTADMVVWSGLSLIVLIGGTGVMFAIYGRWSKNIGWHESETPSLSFIRPSQVGLTKSQRATAWFFFVIAALFLVQTLVGAAAEHYRADISSFFGFDLATWLPYNLARTWHVQLALFWTAAAFLAGGVFLAPLVSGKEPKKQHVLTYVLLGAVAFVVFGSLISEALSVYGVSWAKGPVFGEQWEYIDLPKLFQLLLTLGMFLWVFIIWRAMHTRMRTESVGNMPWVFFFSALSIPMFYAVGLLAGTHTELSVAEFWRFWVVHLWVEDFLELFTTVMVAYIFVMLGVVREKVALGVIYMDVILYSAGGVLGTMHHLYFSGTPSAHMAIGAFFSAAEVIPLTFLTVEAWGFMQLGARRESRSSTPFPHRWTVMFLVAVGFWNFVGAGVFGFLINLPIVSYYEIGTALTANHAHGAMMGVYGMMAMALAMFALRYLIPEDKWSDKLAKISFWCTNIGLAWMVFVTLLPLGILQLYHSVDAGYFEARQLNYITEHRNVVLEWLRMPGDLVFIIGGVLPFLWMAFQGLMHHRQGRTVDELPVERLFVEEAPDEQGRDRLPEVSR